MSRMATRSQRQEVADYEAQRREMQAQEVRRPAQERGPERTDEMATEAIMTQEAGKTQALAIREEAGTLAFATMPEVDFQAQLAALKKGQARIRQVKKELMEEDSHYGTIPGTDKPALLKPGAELLCSVYKLRPDFLPRIEYGDGEGQPPVHRLRSAI